MTVITSALAFVTVLFGSVAFLAGHHAQAFIGESAQSVALHDCVGGVLDIQAISQGETIALCGNAKTISIREIDRGRFTAALR